MNKSEIIDSILETLRAEFESRQAAAKRTRETGNDPESKAEGKYDTRSIEENYLADGLARGAQATVDAASACESIALHNFAPDEPVDIGALVEVQFPDETGWFFVSPAGGGTEVEHAGQTITVITPESPLGCQLIGRKAGERIPDPVAKIRAVQ